MSTRATTFALAATLALTSQCLAAQQGDTLTPAEWIAVAQEKVVLHQWPVADRPWPHLRLYRFIDATPEQSAAMFADYEHQTAYNVDLKQATAGRRLDSARTEVFYRYASNVPMVSDVTYTVLDQIRREPNDAYVITWRLVSGSKVRTTDGSARFSPYRNPATGQVGTLLIYDNLVVPDFFGASLGLVRDKAIAAMRDAVDAIAMETARERTSDRPLLDRQVAALRAALAY
jgi:hypothetical protein